MYVEWVFSVMMNDRLFTFFFRKGEWIWILQKLKFPILQISIRSLVSKAYGVELLQLMKNALHFPKWHFLFHSAFVSVANRIFYHCLVYPHFFLLNHCFKKPKKKTCFYVIWKLQNCIFTLLSWLTLSWPIEINVKEKANKSLTCDV